MLTLEMPHPPLPPPIHSSRSDFSMDPNTNMKMFDQNDMNWIYLDEFCVGCSDYAFTKFDPFAPFKHDQMWDDNGRNSGVINYGNKLWYK